MMRKYLFFLSFILIACGPALPDPIAQAYNQLPDELDYNIHVKPILSDRCFACHGNDKNKIEAGLRLNDFVGATAELPESPGKFAIVVGNLEKSEVFHRICSSDPNLIMPPPNSNLTLTDYEKAVLIKWIEDGAEFKPHWAFLKPEKQALPPVKQKEWVKNPIDHFVLKKLEEKEWQPSEKADKETLLRRVTFDLTGLPPTLQEIDDFLNDSSPDAYEKVVDNLLQRPAYAERMATLWLDIARYADTHGYTVDRFRDMSPWRDWVIQAFDENMPYDTFTIWQLAGDLLPNPTKKQILATGFNRNHQQNMEGGIVDEEFRVEYVADRANTLGTAYLGLTVECARCHDHKYDPISQKEYFELFSFFNNVNEAGQISWNNATPGPTLMLPSKETEALLKSLDQKIIDQQGVIEQLKEEELLRFKEWLSDEEELANIGEKNYPESLEAHFDFSNQKINNKVNPRQKGKLKQMFAKAESIKADFIKGKEGSGLRLDGDAWVDFKQVGRYDKATPFSIGLWVKLPKELENGVLFHKGEGAALFNFRGYHLALKDNRLEVLMAHSAPYNAIVQYAENPPRDQWIHLMMTYDGSSQAERLKVYLDGKRLKTEIKTDNLFKDILFHFADNKPEPGLQLGARWRGAGAKGAIVDDIVVFEKELTELEVLQVANPEAFKSFMEKGKSGFTANEKQLLKTYFFSTNEKVKIARATLKELRREQNLIQDTIAEVMVMEEMKSPRPAYLLERGQYDAHGEEVFPSTINAVLPFPENLPKNRLGLAQWLFHPDHPLTARVAVNRFWLQFFGRGLVKTSNDFGNQGALPSHPELLDWLALEFQSSGWNVKSLLKTIVLSATYQQSSKIKTDMASLDVENIWLWRGPSFRLTAEMMRDNALASSELLVKKIGGKSVKPYQPNGLWKINGATYQRDAGEKLYRRSLYTFWKRTVPLPSQGIFDAPARDVCTVERQKTSTPLQALVLLNDPTFLEAAKVHGEQMAKIENTELAIVQAFKKMTGRAPSPQEVSTLVELQRLQLAKFQQFPDKMKGWLNAGDYQLDQNLALEKIAANAVVASTIMNADATIIKR